jgi:hypothetical protein
MMPRLALMDTNRVAVRIIDERHVANRRRERLHVKLYAGGLQVRDGDIDEQPSAVGFQPGAPDPIDNVPLAMSYSVHCMPFGSPEIIVGFKPSTPS